MTKWKFTIILLSTSLIISNNISTYAKTTLFVLTRFKRICRIQDHVGGYKTLHSGISSRNNVQNSDRQKQGSLWNRDKLFRHHICINETLKWYHQMDDSKNTWQDVTCINIHQSLSGDHPCRRQYSSPPKIVGCYHIGMFPIPLH